VAAVVIVTLIAGFHVEARAILPRHWCVPSFPRLRSAVVGLLLLLATPLMARAAADLFAPTNLVAWCVVPFDIKKRGPEERAEMLQRLGFTRFAYDWRAEHIPSFDAEVAALQKRHIELTAWWFPAALNDDAKAILACLERHHLSPQLWVSMFPPPETDPAKLELALADALKTLGPICNAAQKLGSQVALYNHNGWFGEPANLVTLVRRLRAAGYANVGIVYNLHHAHPHITDFPGMLRLMQPYLLAFNLNGMVRDGDKLGKMVLPVGTGDEEVAMIRTLRDSGWAGPIGILGHTEEDAEVKLGKDLAGLKRIVAQLDTEPKTAAGTPKISGRDAGTQGENDWVDNRWQQTDVGPFLASNLRLPDGSIIAKALTIKVGEHDEGAVVYDTATGALRAAWTGGFLEFNPGRFGLIGAPKPAGQMAFTSINERGQRTSGIFRFTGLHQADRRVVLDYTVDGTHILEMPGLERTPSGPVFRRTFWVDRHRQPLELLAAGHMRGTNSSSHSFEHQKVDNQIGIGADGKATRTRTDVTEHRLVADNREGDTVSAMAVAGSHVQSSASVIFDADGLELLTFKASDQPQVFSVLLWRGKEPEFAGFQQFAEKDALTEDPNRLLRPASSHWPELTTRGQRGADTDILAVDTLTMPYDNPWHALLFASGVDFGPKGEAYVCTIHGDVWRVTGIDDSLRELKWKRYATGLFQPLGLRVREGKVLVLGRDRITRLHDENGDGEADFYENFTDSIATSTGGHDYVTCLEADAAGNLYYVDPKGVHFVTPDGRTNITIATGWRNPNGMGVSPSGLVTVAPQQGEWTPSSQISEVRPGRYHGYGGPHITPEQPLGYEPPLCWIPHSVDNSSGSQVWLPKRNTGALSPASKLVPRLDESPLASHMLHLLWGRCGLMLVLRDTVDEASQGAVVPLPAKFLSGPNRATFNSRDGALYVAGSTGWQTSAIKDGALQRVRWTGRAAHLPVAWHAHTNGITLTFTQPLKYGTAEDVGSYAVKRWNYRYAQQYGSKDWSVESPEKEGRDDVPVKSAKLLPDGRSVFLELGDLTPVMQMEVKWNLDTADGKPMRNQLWLTLNKLDRVFAAER
jgi:sugar phosphate isomerase/epimerase